MTLFEALAWPLGCLGCGFLMRTARQPRPLPPPPPPSPQQEADETFGRKVRERVEKLRAEMAFTGSGPGAPTICLRSFVVTRVGHADVFVLMASEPLTLRCDATEVQP